MDADGLSIVAIIPVYGRTDAVRQVTFLRAHAPVGAMIRFLIVDNGNGSEVSSALKALTGDDCTVLRLGENRGGAGAFRAGMEWVTASQSEAFVWLLDDDAELNEGTLPGLLGEWRRLTTDGIRVGAIGSAQVGYRQRDRIVEAGGWLSPRSGRLIRAHVNEPLPKEPWTERVDYSPATSLLTTTEVLRDVGPFADVFIHYDDTDWGFRVNASGREVFVTSRSVIRHPEWSSKPQDWIVYYDVRNLLWCLGRHLPRTVFWATLLRRGQQALYGLHGRRSVVRLMNLGFAHAKSGELLHRNQLPQPPDRIPAEAALAGSRWVVVMAANEEGKKVWQGRIGTVRLLFLPCILTMRHPLRTLRTLILQAFAQLCLAWRQDCVTLMDCGCVKRWPSPLFARRKVFFWETPEGLRFFKEV